MEHRDVIVIGGGPAGLAAAVALRKKGVQDILILEREAQLGGILRQCIHDGFGLTRFGEALSGPEYAQRFIDEAAALGIPYRTGAMVLELGADRTVTAACREGLLQYSAGAVVLAMGCRERTRGALAIPGDRPAGVMTAGTAQAYINLYNRMPGRDAVILGSGDIGMIMARRLSLEGARVHGVYEVQPYPSGLPRNIEQCLRDYDIPLFLSHTVTAVHGGARLAGVTVAQVDGARRPVPGTEKYVPCDLLILSVGLVPENELSRGAGAALDARTGGALVNGDYATTVPGVFAAGNALHVHDLVDYVSLEAEAMAQGVAAWLAAEPGPKHTLQVAPGEGIGHVLPQRACPGRGLALSLRVDRPFGPCTVAVLQNGAPVLQKRLPRAIPAEMLRLQVPAAALAAQGDLEVCVQC